MMKNRLVEIREQLGLQSNQLAAVLGVSPAWWSRVENGVRETPWYIPYILELLVDDREAVPLILSGAAYNGPVRAFQGYPAYSPAPDHFRLLMFLLSRQPDKLQELTERFHLVAAC